ncbi:related to MYND domain protein [Phialocephala subalpina]|uniref:Related to MYND domain protein n=1 Tax=Phialocephala subalpina TaxID=576137 RepID=A0A1L7WNR6_9HELO|nr:related to MYND domain protein [Phialocephala subalpina]
MDSSDSYSEDETLLLLDKRQSLTKHLLKHPYDLVGYLERAACHSDLAYPDLAASDSYRALLLCDECANEGFEYHDQTWETLQLRSKDGIPAVLQMPGTNQVKNSSSTDLAGGVEGVIEALNIDPAAEDEEQNQQRTLKIAHLASIRCYRRLAISLLLCGCLKSAFEFCTRGLAAAPDDEELLQAKEYIERMARGRLKVDRDSPNVEINDLPDQGLVRREIYPWNDHEPNRFSQATLDFLNGQLKDVAPKCEVRVTELPTLLESASMTDDYGIIPTNKQLGLFAKEDIEPGETVLFEHSLLAANNRLKETLCDACSTELPPLTDDSPVVGCPECDDIMFCNEECLTRAQEEYHPAVCDMDIETLFKDVDPKEKTSALYLHLLARVLAMSATQEVHPLELSEVKYIWGDFLPSRANAVPHSLNAPPPPIWTLPFSFQYNIAGPLHVLEKMDIDIYTSLASYDLWILNTLYSKFRGTASARVNSRNGHPEVAAVHPLWCLANHDCDPNVQWEWGGRMNLWCRGKRIDGKPGGIKAGEEILNHYCDIELKVRDRREWAKGSLGGWCMCDRCRREAGEEMRNGVAQTDGSDSLEDLVNGVAGHDL